MESIWHKTIIKIKNNGLSRTLYHFFRVFFNITKNENISSF